MTVLLTACGSNGPTLAPEPPSSQQPSSATMVLSPSPPTERPPSPSAATPLATAVAPSSSHESKPSPSAAPSVSPAHFTTIRHVAPGDTLSGLAAAYGLSVEQLLAANPQVTNRSLIRVGDELTIPLGLTAVANATLELPPLPAADDRMVPLRPICATGRATFREGSWFPPDVSRDWWNSTWIEDVARTDVDRDGRKEVVALISCQPSQGSFGRVVAFRPLAGGGFATIGLVVEQEWSPEDDPNAIEVVGGIGATESGEVRVRVSDFVGGAPCLWSAVWQVRTYGWNGDGFVQTAGSRAFHVPAGTVKLALAASMRYEAAAPGTWVRTLGVTVRNDGHAPLEDVSIVLPHYDLPWPDPPERTISTLAPGASATVTFREISSSSSCPSSTGAPQVLIGDRQYDDIEEIAVTCE